MLKTHGWFVRTVNHVRTEKRLTSHGRQQWGILYNVRKYDTARPRVGAKMLLTKNDASSSDEDPRISEKKFLEDLKENGADRREALVNHYLSGKLMTSTIVYKCMEHKCHWQLF